MAVYFGLDAVLRGIPLFGQQPDDRVSSQAYLCDTIAASRETQHRR